MTWPTNLSFNQFTATPRHLDDWLSHAVEADVPAIGLNREQIEREGFHHCAELIRETGLTVTIYSSIGYWAGSVEPDGKPRVLHDNLRNLDQAVVLGAKLVGVIPGGMVPGDKDLYAARERIFEGLAEIIPHAQLRGLRLAIEPLNPVFGPRRSIVHTLRETLDLVDRLGAPECLGVVVDAYHVWWEPYLLEQMRRAAGRIFLVQINDWSPELVKSRGPFLDRALPGGGCIDFDLFAEGLCGYEGWLEFEAPNQELREMAPSEMFGSLLKSFELTRLARGFN